MYTPAPTTAEEFITQVIEPARLAYRLGMYSSGFGLNACRLVSAIGSVSVPILSGVTGRFWWASDAIFIDGIVMTLAIVILAVFKFTDRYRVDRIMSFHLADEVRLHAAKAGPYDGLDDAARFRLLVVRVESLLSHSMEEIVAAIVRDPSKDFQQGSYASTPGSSP